MFKRHADGTTGGRTMFKRITSIILALSLALGLCCVVGMAAEVTDSVDFSDTSALDTWTKLGAATGTMDIVDGELQIGSATPYSEVAAVNTAQKYGNFTAEFTYHFVEGINNDGAMFLYHTDANAATGYAVYFVHCPDADRQYYIKLTSRPYSELKAGMFFNDEGQGVDYDEDIQVKIVVADGTHSLYVAKAGESYGEAVYTYTEETPLYTSGYVGVMHWHENDERQSTVAFDDLKITSTGEPVTTPDVTEPSVTEPTVTEPSDDIDESKYEVGTLLWESDLSSGDLETAGLTIQYLPDGSQAGWDIIELNGESMLRGQIAMFNDTIVRLTDAKYKDVTIEAHIILERGNAVSIIGRLQDDGSGHAIILDQHDGVKLCQKNPYVAWKTGGIVELETEYHVVLSMSGNQIKAKVTNLSTNESIIHEIENDNHADAGYVGFAVFGFDNDGVSTATGLIRDMKVYYGAVDLDSLDAKDDEPDTDVVPDVPGSNDTETKEPEFSITAKYADVTIDSAAKKVDLTQKLTISELMNSFNVSGGYGIKVVDKDGNEVTDAESFVTSEMKLVFYKDGANEQVYAIDAPASSNITWVIVIVVSVLVVAAAVVVVIVIGKKKKSK